MSRTFTILLAIILGVMLTSAAQAQRLYRGLARNYGGHGHHHGHHHHHHHGHHHHGHHHHHGFGGGSLFLNFGSGLGLSYYNGPAYGYAWPYDYGLYSGYGNYGLYGTYYRPGSNYVEYYLNSPYLPAELGYGPQAVKQFLGVDRNFALGGLRSEPRVAARIEPEGREIRPQIKEFDWEARKKARKYIDLGDSYFQKQRFYDAMLRYKMAVEEAPDFAEAQLRYGFSLVAMQRYDDAAETLRTAFLLDPELVKGGFRLQELYADNRMVRQAHEEALARAALDADSGDLYFVVGMWLVFHGEPDRSVKFFEKARALGMEAARDL